MLSEQIFRPALDVARVIPALSSLLARESSVISFCFPVTATVAHPRLLHTSGALRESEDNRAAFGVAPS
jgi:hypothetical protein